MTVTLQMNVMNGAGLERPGLAIPQLEPRLRGLTRRTPTATNKRWALVHLLWCGVPAHGLIPLYRTHSRNPASMQPISSLFANTCSAHSIAPPTHCVCQQGRPGHGQGVLTAREH